MKQSVKVNWEWGITVLFFTGIVALFLRDFIFLGQTFNQSDYAVQHFPWAEFYAAQIKQFSLPLWTPLMHAGFPLLAEGQVGAFYPLNLILYFLLPFPVAHNVNIVLHFFLGAMFLYIFLRTLRVSWTPAVVGSLLWVFGSAMAGAEYNFMTMRVLIWLPLALALSERLVRRRRLLDVIGLGLLFFVQMVAGYMQFAFYAIAISSLYFVICLCRQFAQSRKVLHSLGTLSLYGLSCLLGLGLSAIQFLPSFELSDQTLRLTTATIDFAMLGSFPPVAFFSFIFPGTTGVLSGFRLYLGALSIFLIFYALMTWRTQKFYVMTFTLMGGLLLFFSLGSLNPIYAGLVSFFKLFFFRTPAKLTLFVCFFGSILAALGVEQFVKQGVSETFFRARKIYVLFAIVCLAVFLGASLALHLYPDLWIQLGERYVDQFIFGQQFHHHSLVNYYAKVRSVLGALTSSFSLSLFNVISLFFIVLSVGFLFILPRWQTLNRFRKETILILVVIDLFVFSFYTTGFRGNFGTFDEHKGHELAQFLKPEKGEYRIYLYAENAAELERLKITPDQNMSLGLDFIGAYSPLITTRFTDYLSELGNTDDSLGYTFTKPDLFDQNIKRLSQANVKYIYSPRQLSYPALKWVHRFESGNFLYENSLVYPRAYWEAGQGVAKIRHYSNQRIEIETEASVNDWLVLADLHYPGWLATVDGQGVAIERANGLFRRVPVPRGDHVVVFHYNPASLKRGAWITLVTLSIICMMLLAIVLRSRSSFRECSE